MTSKRASFLAVGSELLRADRTDTNSLLVARLLRAGGFRMVEKRCVEDDEAAIASALRELASRTELVMVSGGLGPTADDVTREAAARAFGRAVARHQALAGALEARYRKAGRVMPEIALRMADVVEGAEVLPNPRGTAPGLLLEHEGATVVLLPGVPRELEEIVTTHLSPRWATASGVRVRTLHLGGVYESSVEQRVAPLYERFGRDAITILAGRGLVDLVLEAEGPAAEARLDEMDGAFSGAVGRDVFGRDEQSLVSVVLDLLRGRGWRLATAESCTGGMIGAQVTRVPGASEAFVGGVVAYSNRVKTERLGVPAELIERHGAVSREVAEAMAEGALALGADCAVAVTGIAGPDGGTEDKPVGTVHVVARTPRAARHERLQLPPGRSLIREYSANYTLDLLRRLLEEG